MLLYFRGPWPLSFFSACLLACLLLPRVSVSGSRNQPIHISHETHFYGRGWERREGGEKGKSKKKILSFVPPCHSVIPFSLSISGFLCLTLEKEEKKNLFWVDPSLVNNGVLFQAIFNGIPVREASNHTAKEEDGIQGLSFLLPQSKHWVLLLLLLLLRHLRHLLCPDGLIS